MRLFPRLLITAAAAALIASVCRAQEPVTIEVAAFQGGYGIDFFEQCAREYERTHPNVKIKMWGNPHIWDQLLPRFASDDVPDLCWPGWGMNVWELIFGGKLRPLDSYLQQNAWDSKEKWIDSFKPSLLALGKYEGKIYLFPYNVGAFGWWYNKKMFEQHGWKVPQTYDELLTLCEAIKAEHIAPITWTGRYPSYPLRGLVYPWAISAGGIDVFKKQQNLEPGAWKDPSYIKAAETVLEMKHKQNFQAGCIGMSHTESQMEFLVGRTAMILCGTWLQSEMKDVWPPGFEAEFMLPPIFANGKQQGIWISGGTDGYGWCLPTKGKHPDIGADFFRFMSSPENARKFMEAKGTLMAVKYTGQLNPPQYLKEPLRLFAEAKGTYDIMADMWYPDLARVESDMFRDLYNEVLTPEQFCSELDKANDAVRNDPTIHKFRME